MNEINIELKHRIAILIQQMTALQQNDAEPGKILAVAEMLVGALKGADIQPKPALLYKKHTVIIYPDAGINDTDIHPDVEDTTVASSEIIGRVPESSMEGEVHVEAPSIGTSIDEMPVAKTVDEIELVDKHVATANSIEPNSEKEAPVVTGPKEDEKVDKTETQPLSTSPVSENATITNEEGDSADSGNAQDNMYAELKEDSQRSYDLWSAVSANEIPTIAPAEDTKNISKGVKSLHELIAEKTAQSELFEDTPIKDLKKGIDINDRYQYITELFRGDEAMYERSIKTLNGFRIRPEAEFWIQRELNVKMGWDDNSPVVKKFMHLINRRFL